MMPVTIPRPGQYFISDQEAQVKEKNDTGKKVFFRTKSAAGEAVITTGECTSLRLKAKSFVRGKIDSLGFKVSLPEEAEFHIPGRGGVKIDAGMADLGYWTFPYPTDLTAQFLLVKIKGLWLRIATKSEKLYYPRITVTKLGKGFDLLWNLEPKAPFSQEYETPPVYFQLFPTMQKAVSDYRGWMEKAFKIRPKEDSPFVPEWFHRMHLLLIIDMWLSTGKIVHTYQDIINKNPGKSRYGQPWNNKGKADQHGKKKALPDISES